MVFPTDIKNRLLSHLHQAVDQKIATSKSMIDSAVESKTNETKSTAGDKYETGRAMMQAEQEKSEVRLAQSMYLKNVLNTIKTDHKHKLVQMGSLVSTKDHHYFISIGMGKIILKDHLIYAISPESPIGKLLLGKKVDDKFIFQEKLRHISALL